jgi:hypothetical protein
MDKEQMISTLREQVVSAKNIRQSAKNNPGLLMAKTVLKNFQSDRLKETHADLLASPNTRGAATFFLKEIYSSKDLSQRDNDLERLIPIMEKTFPLNTLEVITQAITLDALTEKMDTAMAIRLGVKFSPDEYIQAFREVTSKEERLQQINMIDSLGKSLSGLVKIPFLSMTLKMMRGPAKIANLYAIHEFLESGFTVFKETKNPEAFVNSLVQREKQLIEQIYSTQENALKLKL